MAMDEINAAGGVGGKKLELMSFDTAGKPDQAVVGLRKLAEDDKVLAIVGPFSSSECRVVFPAAERAGVAIDVDGVFGAKARRALQLRVPQYFGRRLHVRARNAARSRTRAIRCDRRIAYATDDVISKVMGEKVLPGIMKKSGVDVKVSVTFQTQAFDLAPQVSQLKGQPTDLIGVGSGPEAGDAARAGIAPPGP